jgi:hypothetical protein
VHAIHTDRLSVIHSQPAPRLVGIKYSAYGNIFLVLTKT